jgi:PKD domain
MRKRSSILALSLAVLVSVASPSAGALNGASLFKGARPSKVPFIVSQFTQRVANARAHGKSAARLSNPILHSTKSGAIELVFHAKGQVGAAQRKSLVALGASIVTTVSQPAKNGIPAVGQIQAKLPFNRVNAAAALKWVVAVTPPDYGSVDAVTSEGVAFHRANLLQTRGINGTGVTVGVISNGVSNLAAAQASNDLPAGVTVLNTGSGDEGTAMLEIVNDMAPGAALMFNATGGGVANHVNALNNLVTNGANVIAEDIPFDAEPAFERGLAAQTAENIAAAGVSVHSSAGNLAQTHSARVTATGTGAGPDGTTGPYSGCANAPDNVVAIAPNNDTTFDVTLGQSSGNGASFTLQWSEPRAIFPTAGQGGFTDLNLYVMNAALTQCLAQSTSVQANGQGDTIEQVSLPAALAGTAAKVVVDVQGTSTAVAAPILDLRWRQATAVDTPTRAGSLNPDSNYTGQATSAAALDAQNSGAIESYSGGGPVQLITTTQCAGGAAGPCTGVAGTSQTANGPTWGAADDVTVSGAGGFPSPFRGTSASAPHAAACDALLRDYLNNASAAPATTNARLAATAIDIAPAGTDNVTGAGQLDCLAAANAPPVANAGGPYTTNEGTDVQLDATGSTDPDAGDSIASYSWDLNNDGVFGDSALAKPTFSDVGDEGVHTVKVTVTDTAGATDTASTTLMVNNVAPTTTIAQNGPKPENTAVTISGVVTDPGWEDPLTATVDWGDGSGSVALGGAVENVRPDATLAYSLPHTYGDNGSFLVQVCGYDPDGGVGCASTTVVITNVDPTATIDTSGATMVNGVPTFINHAGQPITFAGNSVDPGSDDLTLTWHWGDGTPDESLVSLVNPPFVDPTPSPSIQPRDVTDTRDHTFGAACLYTLTFTSRDDDGGLNTTSANVIIAGNDSNAHGPGFWQTQYRPRPTALPEGQRLCLLAIANYVSQVFSEARPGSTLAAAFDVLSLAGNGGNESEKLDRQLMVAWLNFANGAFEFGQLVDTGNDLLPFSTVMSTAETVRLNPSSTTAQLRAQRQILQRINPS